MIWNDHSKQFKDGQHAFLSPSSSAWLRYTPEKLAERYKASLAAAEGTATHAFAALCITRNQNLPRSHKTLNMFVNDAIGFKMRPEQKLYFSENCFGTTDAICFRNSFLRIHDLKTGETPAHMEQLMIYAALFCLEYRVKPGEIGMELRIYQNNDIVYDNPTAEDIGPIMDTIVTLDKYMNAIKEEVM